MSQKSPHQEGQLSTEDAKIWCSESEVEANHVFRQSLGKAFFNGFNHLCYKHEN